MSGFKVGDLVVLKEGGIPMKVSKIAADANGRPALTCDWFANGALQQAAFSPGQVRPYSPEQPDVVNPPLGA